MTEIRPPTQRTTYDLTVEPRETDNRPHLSNVDGEARKADDMMRALGFEPTQYMNPKQFLIAVMNDDLDKIFRNPKRKENYEKKGGIALSYRIECAKTAAKYLHSKPPEVRVTSSTEIEFGQQLAAKTAQAGERVRRKVLILEEVERISPDAPLAPASYPTPFAGAIVHEHEPLASAEGDTDYDPDADDA